MQIQPIVVGTAGHIDHGKSTLVKTLTGIDPDRLKEEQERGMTIDIGFARFSLPDGRRVGIVDVPGHERFVKNMVAGATGIDLVVLVVAADDGVMPQTREHLAIMRLLGVKRGFVALTKIDAVEPAMVELARDDVKAAVLGTFLESAPIVPVSSITGEGLDELRKILHRMAAETPPRSDAGIFRMPIQRVFSAHGFGTIVTGIPVSGSVAVGDVLEILPLSRRGKVRGIQAYHETTDRARAGHSTAINLADVDHHEVQRGFVAASVGFFKPVRLVGAQLEALESIDRPIANRTPIRLHTGTVEALGEVVLLDREELAPGDTGLVQLRLEEPIVCAPGDRYVLRLASPSITLGGGVILEESKHRLKRFKNFVVEELSRQVQGLESPRELLDVVLSRAADGVHTAEELSIEIKRSKADTERLLNDLKGQGRARSLGAHQWIHAERLERAIAKIQSALESWFAEHAHRQVIDVRDLRRVVGYEAEFLHALLAEAARRGLLVSEPGGLVRPAGKKPELDTKLTESAERVRRLLLEARFTPPSPEELATRLGIAPKEIASLLEHLADTNAVHRVAPDFHLAREHFEAARAAIVENCGAHGALDIPSLRDKLATTRKFLIPLLEHFDAQGLTIRQGGHRVLKRR
jgi:selenocysteine-specific elongation factor